MSATAREPRADLRTRSLPLALLLAATAALAPGRALAAGSRPALFSLAIGYNGAPAGDADLAPLQFADDDAAAFHELVRSLARRSVLLAMLDTQSQQRFPDLVAEARAPALGELRRAVAELNAAMATAAAAGEQPSVLVFYSGHGRRGGSGGDDQGGLAFLDGELTHDRLYEWVIAALPAARYVHLFIDACHAEAVVRTRDRDAQRVTPSPEQAAAFVQQATLARFPHVGAVVASTADTVAHEWDAYGSGVFTHEILSALRGAADIDGNQRIEYSELGAFVAAANHAVSDPRARPQILVHPPPLDRRTPIVDLSAQRDGAVLTGRAPALASFFIEDERGNRLLDVRAEREHSVRLVIPAGRVLHLRSGEKESVLHPRGGEVLRLEDLGLVDESARRRGAVESALRRGLFATPYGAGYYRGFVHQAEGLVSVDVPAGGALALEVPLASREAPRPPLRDRTAGRVLVGAGALLAVGAGVLGALALSAYRDVDGTQLELPAQQARDRYMLNLTLSLSALGAAAISGGIGAYLLARDRAPGER